MRACHACRRLPLTHACVWAPCVVLCADMPASDAVRARVRRLEGVCRAFGVPLIAAALQYPLRHRAVCSIIPGAASAAEVASNVELMNVCIPEQLWEAMEREGLLPPPPDLR